MRSDYSIAVKIETFQVVKDRVKYTRCQDIAQFGSALPWGGRGRGFKSRYSDHFLYSEKDDRAYRKEFKNST